MMMISDLLLISFLACLLGGAVASNRPDYIGCYVDDKDRDLSGYAQVSSSMTIETCLDICGQHGYNYAGLQHFDECYCGNDYGSHGKANENDCKTKCKGDSSQICGGSWKNSVYKISVYIGCYVDKSDRDLSGYTKIRPSMTIESCMDDCSEHGYKYAGLQHSDECYCDNEYGSHGKANENECNARCEGNSSQICGGKWKNSIYRTTVYIGCYLDDKDRDLSGYAQLSASMTIETCMDVCSEQGYKYAGLQHIDECYCDNEYGSHGKANENECNSKCGGNKAQICGGNWKNSIYRTTVSD